MSRVDDLRAEIFRLEDDLICSRADLTYTEDAIDNILWELNNARGKLFALKKEGKNG